MLRRAAALALLLLVSMVPPSFAQAGRLTTVLDKLAGAADVPRLAPAPGTRSFRVTGNTQSIYSAIGSAFGIKFRFDESVRYRNVPFNFENIDFATAMGAASLVTGTFSVPLSATEALIAADTPDRHRALDRHLLRTFYFTDTTSLQDLNEIQTMLRVVFDIRYAIADAATRAIDVRAPQPTLEAVERLLRNLDLSRPQVMLEIQAYEIDRSVLTSIGVELPLQFQVFNINSAVLAALGGANIQDLINQIIAAGGLNALNNLNAGSLAALVAQLQNQQQSIFANPLATFGGGTTLFGIGVPPASAHFLRNESLVRLLQRTSVRAQQGDPATIHIGERYPVLTQSFSTGVSVGNVPVGSISGVVPGFQYEDLGIVLKATPKVHATDAVTLNMEFTLKALGAMQFNSIPTIQNRAYTATITVKNGEPAVLAGITSRNESSTIRGIPGISYVPLLTYATSRHDKNLDESEILFIITPHILSSPSPNVDVIPIPTWRQ